VTSWLCTLSVIRRNAIRPSWSTGWADPDLEELSYSWKMSRTCRVVVVVCDLFPLNVAQDFARDAEEEALLHTSDPLRYLNL
jgi:hypothetical protein